MCFSDISGYVGSHVDGINGVRGDYDVGLVNLEGTMLVEFCLDNELCVSFTLVKRGEKRKVTFRLGESETEIDFVLIRKGHWWFL